MNDWIDLSALWRILVAGLLFGAGLPILFGVGLRLLTARPGIARAGETETVSTNPVSLAAAVLCFVVVLAAIGWGIYLIVAQG